VATSTNQQYASCIKKYIRFCIRLDLAAFPVHQTNLVLFASELAITTSHTNIKVHLSAIKFYSQVYGYGHSFTSFNQLFLALRGIKRTQGSKFKKPQRAPITPEMLRNMHYKLFNSSRVFEDKIMIWAAMLTAFFGFLRVSEYTSSHVNTFDTSTTLCHNNISFHSPAHNTSQSTQGNPTKYISLHIKAAKNDPFRQGATIRLSPNQSMLCPVMALQRYVAIHPTRNGPLFTFSNGQYLTKSSWSSTLKDLNIEHLNISSHSFRIGAATTAAKLGYPQWLIQAMGRWSSDCFKLYIRIPASAIDSLSSAMGNL
jgi:hypothetical protein